MRLLIVLSVLSVCAVAQEGKRPNPFAEPKNLKILKTSGPQLRETMLAFNAALGVQCGHCHVQGDFPSDANPKKEMARTMLTMTREINGHFPTSDGAMKVRCYTCHRGAVTPLTAPPDTGAAKQ
jgi:hypothetical protein